MQKFSTKFSSKRNKHWFFATNPFHWIRIWWFINSCVVIAIGLSVPMHINVWLRVDQFENGSSCMHRLALRCLRCVGNETGHLKQLNFSQNTRQIAWLCFICAILIVSLWLWWWWWEGCWPICQFRWIESDHFSRISSHRQTPHQRIIIMMNGIWVVWLNLNVDWFNRIGVSCIAFPPSFHRHSQPKHHHRPTEMLVSIKCNWHKAFINMSIRDGKLHYAVSHSQFDGDISQLLDSPPHSLRALRLNKYFDGLSQCRLPAGLEIFWLVAREDIRFGFLSVRTGESAPITSPITHHPRDNGELWNNSNEPPFLLDLFTFQLEITPSIYYIPTT